MAWGRFGDTAHSHRKVLRASASSEERGCAVWGFTTLCGSWSAQEGLDGFVSDSAARRIGGPSYLSLVKDAQAAGLIARGRARSPAGDRGWTIVNDDPELLHLRTREEVERDRDRSRATRQVEPQRVVRLRDGDQCRYCGKTVNWKDRVSARGGTYDHPDPEDRDLFVVCCFGCNRTKSDRTVEQWVADGGRELLPVPDDPLIGPKTAEQFGVSPTPTSGHPGPRPNDAATARPSSQLAPEQPDLAATPGATSAAIAGADPAASPGAPDAAPAGATADPNPPSDLPDLDLPEAGVADLPASGRDGQQVGGGSGLAGGRSRDGPRRRGSRGSRGRSRKPP